MGAHGATASQRVVCGDAAIDRPPTDADCSAEPQSSPAANTNTNEDHDGAGRQAGIA